ncbi:MAG: diacylglycerol kinase [Cellvibrionales bacterium]|nr:diacylglycerol kinase [Cellvibrionales bacterium]
MNKPQKTGLARIKAATGYSIKGLKAAWINEAAFRQEAIAMLLMTPLAFWVGQSGLERAVLIAVCFLVILMELVNSAIEAVVDRISDERHPLSGQAKDMGSAAVFLSLILVAITWGFIFIDNFA